MPFCVHASSKLSTCSMLSSNGRSLSWIFDSLRPTSQVSVLDGSGRQWSLLECSFCIVLKFICESCVA